MAKKMRTWEGGYVLKDAHGRDLFYVRKQVDGVRYDFSTRSSSLRAAMKHLERFEANPRAYLADRDNSDPLYLDEKLCAAFLGWSRDEKHNSQSWVRNQKLYLAFWAEVLSGIDLRRVELNRHILRPLDGISARGKRIAVLKTFYSWLRTTRHAIKPHEDPTLKTLLVPQARPEQWKRVKSVSREDFFRMREKLGAHWRDAADVQAGTGWHVTELARFARDGGVEPYHGASYGVGGVLLCPQTKSGTPLKTAVSPAVFEAGRHLLEVGGFSIEHYVKAVKAACREAGVKVFGPGQFRHSVATWAINQGADPALVAAFLNHKSPQTTRRFYATHAVPTKVPTLL